MKPAIPALPARPLSLSSAGSITVEAVERYNAWKCPVQSYRWIIQCASLGYLWELILTVSFQIFCSRCSSHSAPLPRYGQMKPVRVCTHCYMFHVTPFYSDKAGIWPHIITESTQFMQWTESRLCTKQMLHFSGNGDLVTVIVPAKQGFRLRPLQMAEAETWNTQPGVMIQPVSVALERRLCHREPKGFISLSIWRLQMFHICLSYHRGAKK